MSIETEIQPVGSPAVGAPPAVAAKCSASRRAVALGAFTSAYAGLVHLVVAPEHLGHWWVFGVFMIAVGVGQIGLAGWVLRRPGTSSAMVGILGSLAIVAVYFVAHTRGIDIGPAGDDGHGGGHDAETAGPAAIAATVGELVTIGAFITLLPLMLRRRVVNLLGALGLGAWALWLLGGLG